MPPSRAQSTERQDSGDSRPCSRPTSRETSPRREQRQGPDARPRAMRADSSPERRTRSGQHGPMRPPQSSPSFERASRRSDRERSKPAAQKPAAGSDTRQDQSASPRPSGSTPSPDIVDGRDIDDDYGWPRPTHPDVQSEQNTSRHRSKRPVPKRPATPPKNTPPPAEDDDEFDDFEWPSSEFSEPPSWPETSSRRRNRGPSSFLNSILRRSPPDFGGFLICDACQRRVSPVLLRSTRLLSVADYFPDIRCSLQVSKVPGLRSLLYVLPRVWPSIWT